MNDLKQFICNWRDIYSVHSVHISSNQTHFTLKLRLWVFPRFARQIHSNFLWICSQFNNNAYNEKFLFPWSAINKLSFWDHQWDTAITIITRRRAIAAVYLIGNGWLKVWNMFCLCFKNTKKKKQNKTHFDFAWFMEL